MIAVLCSNGCGDDDVGCRNGGERRPARRIPGPARAAEARAGRRGKIISVSCHRTSRNCRMYLSRCCPSYRSLLAKNCRCCCRRMHCQHCHCRRMRHCCWHCHRHRPMQLHLTRRYRIFSTSLHETFSFWHAKGWQSTRRCPTRHSRRRLVQCPSVPVPASAHAARLRKSSVDRCFHVRLRSGRMRRRKAKERRSGWRWNAFSWNGPRSN